MRWVDLVQSEKRFLVQRVIPDIEKAGYSYIYTDFFIKFLLSVQAQGYTIRDCNLNYT